MSTLDTVPASSSTVNESVKSQAVRQVPLVDILLSKDAWVDFFLGTPCVQHGFLWGAATGSIITAHKLFMKPGFVFRAVNMGMVASLVGATFGFFACTREVEFKYAMTKESMKRSKIDQSPTPLPDYLNPNASTDSAAPVPEIPKDPNSVNPYLRE